MREAPPIDGLVLTRRCYIVGAERKQTKAAQRGVPLRGFEAGPGRERVGAESSFWYQEQG